jgi:hypothetical protein
VASCSRVNSKRLTAFVIAIRLLPKRCVLNRWGIAVAIGRLRLINGRATAHSFENAGLLVPGTDPDA